MGSWNPLKRWTRGNVHATPQGRTFKKRHQAQPKCSNDIMGPRPEAAATGKQGKCQRGPQADHSAGDHEPSS
jgi:hypothetical protein